MVILQPQARRAALTVSSHEPKEVELPSFRGGLDPIELSGSPGAYEGSGVAALTVSFSALALAWMAPLPQVSEIDWPPRYATTA